MQYSLLRIGQNRSHKKKPEGKKGKEIEWGKPEDNFGCKRVKEKKEEGTRLYYCFC